MWDGYEEQANNKPYIWIAFFLLLIVMSSIFFLRPTIGGRPAGEIPSSRNIPLVTPLEQSNIGAPIYMRNSLMGYWAVHAQEDYITISSLDALGLTLWGQELSISSPLISSRGAYLVVAEAGGDLITVFHSTGMQLARKEITGSIQSISVSAAGEIAVAFNDPVADPLYLKSHLALYSNVGLELWAVSIPGVEVLKIEQSSDGQIISVLGLHLDGGTAPSSVLAYSRHGSRLFSKELTGRPVDTQVRGDGNSVVVATNGTIYSFDRQGGLHWSFSPGAELTGLSFVGSSANVLFSGERRSLLTFGLQSVVGVLSDDGQLAWQYRSRDRIHHTGTSEVSSNIIIGSENRVSLYSPDGNVRWSMQHQWGQAVQTATSDGRNYLLHSDKEAVILRSQ